MEDAANGRRTRRVGQGNQEVTPTSFAIPMQCILREPVFDAIIIVPCANETGFEK
jgi:hypothetical protein